MAKEKKIRQPQYYLSLTNIKVLNYKEYYMNFTQKIITVLIAFLAGGAVGYLFYGGLAKDQYGTPTRTTWICNILVFLIMGGIAVKLFLPVREKQLCDKRIKQLREQFVDMLDSFSTSLAAGKNVNDSFKNVYEDLKAQYSKDAYMSKEVKVILTGIDNGIEVEKLLMDFGKRSGINDVESFANVFSISFRKGGNLKDIIQNTHKIISDKMEVELGINTIVASNKMEQNIMIALPIFLVGTIKLMSPDFAANFSTPAGILATTIAVVSFVVAYFVGQKILDIKM